jgi:transmembrane sensor
MMDAGKTAAASAENIEASAAAWLIKRREHENWGEPDQAELDAWLAESWAHATAFWRLGAAWNSADRLGVLHRPDVEQATGFARTLRPFLLRGAMGLVAAILLGMAGFAYLSKAHEKTYATMLGEHRTIRLADGSAIELNTDTVLHVSVNTRSRIVTLDHGEAFFQIKHDAARPFVVLAAEHRVVDVGTKFLLRRDADRVEVSLIEGRARFETAHQPQTPLLTPGDVAVATADNVSITRKSASDMANALGWRRNLLVFHHTTLADAASEYNRYNRAKIIIADRSTAQLMMNGTLPTDDVEAFVRLAQRFFDLRVDRRGEEIVISR